MAHKPTTSYLALRTERIGKTSFGDFELLRSMGLSLPSLDDVARPQDAPEGDPRRLLSTNEFSAFRTVCVLSYSRPAHTLHLENRGWSPCGPRGM